MDVSDQFVSNEVTHHRRPHQMTHALIVAVDPESQVTPVLIALQPWKRALRRRQWMRL